MKHSSELGSILKSKIALLPKSIERFGWARSAAVFSSIALVSLVAVRLYYSLVTGYMLPDESYYYDTFVLDKVPLSLYRPFFQIVFLLFFHGTNGMFQLFLRGALYSAIWAVGCVFVLYKILRVLAVPDKPLALVLISLPLFPVFTVMALFFVTETLGLFLALAGILFSARYVKGNKLTDVFISAVFFVLAYEVREPYLLLALGNFFVLLLVNRRLKALVVYALVVSLVIPVPASLSPITITQPVSNFLFFTVPHYLSGLHPSIQTGTPGSPNPSTNATAPATAPTHVTTIPVVLSWNEIVDSIFGIFYGFGPLFAIFVPFSLLLTFKNRSSLAVFVLLTMLLALTTFLISSDLTATGLYSGLGKWGSDVVRLTSTAVPVLVGFGYFYSKVKTRYLLVLLLLYIVLGSALLPQLGTVLQSSQNTTGQPIDRLSFDYRAPYYRMYLIAGNNSGRTLVIGGVEMRGIRVFMSMLPNVILTGIPQTQKQLNSLLNQSWSAVYLYDDYITIFSPQLVSGYPAYYQHVVLSHSYDGFAIQPLWVDGESYALKLVRQG